MKTALVHDDLVQAGGAERVVIAMHDMFPDAPLYTSVYDPKATFSPFRDMDVRTSYLQRTPLASRRMHKLALPLFPSAFEQFDFTGYDLVISSASRFAKGIITPPEACHVCYCHTPPRFAWRPQDYFAQNATARTLEPLMRQMMTDLRVWDTAASQRVDYFVANSHNSARRIRKYYRRDAAVIHPPIETAKYTPIGADQVGKHFLVVSRLVGYKRVDLAVAACNLLGAELRVVGTGPEMAALQAKAGPTVRFLGRLSDAEVAAEYARCRAFLFPGEEDFGLTPLEAMASGRPVVAYGAGGALETIIPGRTGLFFAEQTPESLAGALRRLDETAFSPSELRAHAERFDLRVFREQMSRFVEDALAEHRRAYAQESPSFLARANDTPGSAPTDGQGVPGVPREENRL